MKQYRLRPEVIARLKADKSANPEKYYQRQKKAELARSYGMVMEEYMKLVIKQAGCCAICTKEMSGRWHKGLFVDHNHKTGQVRGLLCNNCNSALGMFQDSIEILQAAINYLELPE